ncbi:MAG: NADH-quinone oxidoreductase subunit M [Phycisphaeraceae bacterium]
MTNLIPFIPTLAAAGETTTASAWLLPLMVLIPLLSALAIALFIPADRPATVRAVALWSSVLGFALAMLMLVRFDWSNAGAFQFASYTPWMEGLGIGFRFGADAVSVWLIVLAALLLPLTILGTWHDIKHRVKEYFVWLLVLQTALVGVFSAMDLILFYVFFEMTLIPLFFLIGIFGSGNRIFAATKFFVFTLAGSIFTLVAVLYVAYFHAGLTGEWTFSIPQLVAVSGQMSPVEQGWVLMGLLIGFSVKVPLFPVHTWLPLAHTEAPTAGSVILAGVLLKLGSYGLLRFALPMAPEAIVTFAPYIAIFAIIAILYAALICWVQTDMKKLVAYSSVSHMGFCVLGLVALNAAGVGGSIIYMINHGLATGALFLCVGMIYSRFHTRELAAYSGLGKRLPIWSFFFVFFCLASVGLPGLNGFVGEFLTILGAFTATDVLGIPFAIFATLGVILAAIYILYMVNKVVFGPVGVPTEEQGAEPNPQDLNTREIATLAPLAVLCLVLGLYPTPMLQSFEPTIDNITAAAQQVIAERNPDETEAPAVTEQPADPLQTTIPAAAEPRAQLHDAEAPIPLASRSSLHATTAAHALRVGEEESR